ncbi:uncharacterized protein BDR25DRAFT_374034 [Lindgomyces ingoldianus]|uniref:Uncharacterized protein n=1 Tax=Lindgomyces ingoldianus TaxID=673940 RepID=A0ACB6QLC9_9PLEO|nr:uncharacterized protein BDR25DRAFT_374034 [Lindgomyces ingoldianus]KAF2467803.1 hypothetical protein BDR25DRAFT_374034 [Lindgomyces ingoldianus]
MVNFIITTLFALSTFALAAPAPLESGADYPDEVVLLTACDNGKTGIELKIQDRMFYYQDDYARRRGEKYQDKVLQTQIHDPSRHDGFNYHIDWDAGKSQDDAISARFPNSNHQFKVWGLPADGAKGTKANLPVAGNAQLDGAPFKCYKESSFGKDTDGFKCRLIFSCTRIQREVRFTNITLDDEPVIVSNSKCPSSGGVKNASPKPINAKDAFANLREAVKNRLTTKEYDIGGSNCKIIFPTLKIPRASPGYNDTTPEQIADILIKEIGAKVEAKRTKGNKVCPGGRFDKHQLSWEQVLYPRAGRFEIQIAAQTNQQWHEQTTVEFRVRCPCSDNSGALSWLQGILGVASFTPYIGQVFGIASAGVTIASLATGACDAK